MSTVLEKWIAIRLFNVILLLIIIRHSLFQYIGSIFYIIRINRSYVHHILNYIVIILLQIVAYHKTKKNNNFASIFYEKVSPLQAMKARVGCGCNGLLIHSHDQPYARPPLPPGGSLGCSFYRRLSIYIYIYIYVTVKTRNQLKLELTRDFSFSQSSSVRTRNNQ